MDRDKIDYSAESLEKISQRGALFFLDKIKHYHKEIAVTASLYERTINGESVSKAEWQDNIRDLSSDLSLELAIDSALALNLASALALNLDSPISLDSALALALASVGFRILALDIVKYLNSLLAERVPYIENLDAKILNDINNHGYHLEMGSWHTCETTHCRAGFAEVYGGDQAKELVKYFGHWLTGGMIYWRSSGYIPDFYASNEDAMRDIIEKAAQT